MSKVDLEKLIRLANLEIEPEIIEKFSESVANILDWCEELQAVDTTGIQPMFSVFEIFSKGIENLRDDEVTDGNITKEILQNCQDKYDVFICVPKVIEQE